MNAQSTTTHPAHRLSVAPMLDVTDRHARYLYRLLSKNALLYTEMVTTGAILFGDQQHHLRYDAAEHPVALQLGGSDPDNLARCTEIANNFGYDEVNLNVGCPSDRVQSGKFGACLMNEPELVRKCIAAMSRNSDVPVTVKCRLGVDKNEDFDLLLNFIDCVAQAPCNHFIIHARKAWLDGLSPKENRTIPPLRYEWVYRLKQLRPELEIVINGGIVDIESCQSHLAHVDGVMLGRAIQQNPMLLSEVDAQIFAQPSEAKSTETKSAEDIILEWLPYVEQEIKSGSPLHHMSRHIITLFQGVPGARRFRRHISENAHVKGAGTNVILDALDLVKGFEAENIQTQSAV